MEKYDAILRTVNDKIADQEKTIEYYRGEVARIEKFNADLSQQLEKAEAKLKELSNNYDKLHDSFDKKLDENAELKAANAKLTAKINENEKF